MKFDEIVRKRKSVRDFGKKKADWRWIIDAVDLANQGPFAGNHNNLKFLIVEDKSSIKDIAGFCEQAWIKQSGILILVCSDDRHLESLYGERGRIYSRQQAGAAIQTILLKLTERGIDSCWVGAYTDELLKTKLNIPQHIQIEAVIPVGFESVKHKKPEKKTLDQSMYWDKWGNERRTSIFTSEKEDYRPGL